MKNRILSAIVCIVICVVMAVILTGCGIPKTPSIITISLIGGVSNAWVYEILEKKLTKR